MRDYLADGLEKSADMTRFNRFFLKVHGFYYQYPNNFKFYNIVNLGSFARYNKFCYKFI